MMHVLWNGALAAIILVLIIAIAIVAVGEINRARRR